MMLRQSTTLWAALALLLHSGLLFSQGNTDCPSPAFFKTFGAPLKAEYATTIIRSNDNHLLLAGRDGSRTFIQKINTAGVVLWTREFQVSAFESVTPSEIIQDSDGMIVGCGTLGQAGLSKSYVFRYDPSNNIMLWGHQISSNNPTVGGILEKGPGGPYILYQNSLLASGERDAEIIEIDRLTGTLMPGLAKRYEYISSDVITKMVYADGALYATGSSASFAGSINLAVSRQLLARFNAETLDPIWAQLSHRDTFATASFKGRDLLIEGDALIAAYVGADETVSGVSGNDTIFIQKTDLEGNIQWARSYSFVAGVLKLMSLPDGYLVYGQQHGHQHVVFKTDKDGVPIWGRLLTESDAGSVFANNFAPNQAVMVADSLYATGLSTNGNFDVFLWKMYGNGIITNGCDQVDTLVVTSALVANPAQLPINLAQVFSTASAAISAPVLQDASLELHQFCPDCTVPDPCPEDNDFVVTINDVYCDQGKINLRCTFCDADGGPLPNLDITFFDADPYGQAATALGSYSYTSVSNDSCRTVVVTDLVQKFGAANIFSGASIYAVINVPGNAETPFNLADFPLSDYAECDYTNNASVFTVQLPTAALLHLGSDQTVCPNTGALLDGGPGYFRYQWSNGQTTPSITANFSGQFRLTVTDFCGYKQSDTVAVVVLQTPQLTENAAFCPGQSVTVRGFFFNQPGVFQRTLPGVNGDCDTTASFFITQLPYQTRNESVQFCPGETVTINGVDYQESGLAKDTLAGTIGCDTIVFYFLNELPAPFRFDTAYICPGDSVKVGNYYYDQPGLVFDTIPTTTAYGCDTVIRVRIFVIPQFTTNKTIAFCPGTSVDIAGELYTQPGTVTALIPGNGSQCDTLAQYTLVFSDLPARSDTVTFCAGSSVVIGGQTYSQPTTVVVTVPGIAGACDTVVTYTLLVGNPVSSTLTAQCPALVNTMVAAGANQVVVNYGQPSAQGDCACPGIAWSLTAGIASGSLFPTGTTTVCYTARDSCGSTAECCFDVVVDEESACESKTAGCVKYDIVSITTDAEQRYTYRIRVTNTCANKLIYTAIQLPFGVVAASPTTNSVYESPDQRQYLVRNPNYSPFYSIRFSSINDSIASGASSVLKYTLPPQVHPTFIRMYTRLKPQVYADALLNTFYCPVGVTPSSNRSADNEAGLTALTADKAMLLYPNPTSGLLLADVSDWQGQSLSLQVLDARGRSVQRLSLVAGSEAYSLPLSAALPNGLYFLELMTESGERAIGRFVIAQ